MVKDLGKGVAPTCSKGPATGTTKPPIRPKLDKVYTHLCTASRPLLPSSLSILPKDVGEDDEGEARWIPLSSAPAYYPIRQWLTTMEELIKHPELNSSNILRAEILEEEDFELFPSNSESSDGGGGNIGRNPFRKDGESGGEEPSPRSFRVGGYRLGKRIRRKILPRRPGLDWSMNQECQFFEVRRDSEASSDHDEKEKEEEEEGGLTEAVVVYTPIMSGERHDNIPTTEEVKGGVYDGFPQSPKQIPFYHPRVRSIAFRYISSHPSSEEDGKTSPSIPSQTQSTKVEAEDIATTSATPSHPSPPQPKVFGKIRIEVVLFPSNEKEDLFRKGQGCSPSEPESFYLPPSHRLQRISLSLLQTIHTMSWGRMNNYKKRVHHDQIVPREAYQDLYLRLKERHASRICNDWREATDPKKHVFEDLGIAAFIMLLWKDTFPPRTREEVERDCNVGGHEGGLGEREADLWGRPPGGFVDIGCGNGLLVHILNQEGYKGYGIDLRARKSWDAYPYPKADLRVESLRPHEIVLSTIQGVVEDERGKVGGGGGGGGGYPFPKGCFLLGNHADELTPWMPLLATCPDLGDDDGVEGGERGGGGRRVEGENVKLVEDYHCQGYISIPCCPFELCGKKFTKSKWKVDEGTVSERFPTTTGREEKERKRISELIQETISRIRLGPVGNPGESDPLSRNLAFLTKMSQSSLDLGWKVEKEALRIPSTRNWCIVGRSRIWDLDIFPSASYSSSSQASDGREEEGSSWREEFKRNSKSQIRERILESTDQAFESGWKARVPEGNAGKAVREEEARGGDGS
ncbi:DUF1613-domain-containing protein [Violaceomyces palustris]|uniref:DUF1613-domain-containing protein n=1 Tax=Violaceomyces palustris TaxID=1673888 RepID=A0ACD0P3R1_9BASI|nr:DUF1613-domain-containing protein [Violaceomyces palustris]